MVEILRTCFKGEIISEFLVPKKKTNKVIILCGGMPGSPSKKEVLKFYWKKGYWVFAPRYRGSWESYGRFLQKSPHQDILDVIDGLSNEFVNFWDNKKYKIKNPQIYVIGVSFGGPAALLISNDKRVKKVLAIAPVIDWRVDSKVEPLGWLGKFTKKAFGNAYRYSMKDWNKLRSGKFYNPITNLNRIAGNKIWIIQAKDDDLVFYKPSVKFAELTGCKLTLVKKGGHAIGKILTKPSFYKRLKKFFSSTN